MTVLGMADALARGEPSAVAWAEDVTGAAVRMIGGRRHREIAALAMGGEIRLSEASQSPKSGSREVHLTKVEATYQIKGRGTALVCQTPIPPRLGGILRSRATGQAWSINGVESHCIPWGAGRKCGLFISSRDNAAPYALPMVGDEVEMIEPLDLLARLEAAERRIAELEEQALEAENIALERDELD